LIRDTIMIDWLTEKTIHSSCSFITFDE